jgi:hypothetical protein
MNEPAEIASFLVIVVYPFLTGPALAFLLPWVLKREGRWPGQLFFPLLAAAHAAGYILMARTLGEYRLVSAGLAFLLSLILASVTAIGLRMYATRRFNPVVEDPARRRLLAAGMILVPLFQLGTVGLLALLSPSL